MRDRFSVQFPKKYDPANPAATVVPSSVVIAWGDYDQKQANPGQIFGLLLAIEPGAAAPVVIKGATLAIHPELWVVVFQPVPPGHNYVLEVWKVVNGPGGAPVRDKILCRLGPVAVQPRAGTGGEGSR